MDKKILDEVKNLVTKAKKIVVFTGAGVSTNSGVPDFRGPNGLYSTVGKRFNLPYPEAVFDIDYFHRNPLPFFQLSKEMFGEKIQPTLFHKFVANLEKHNKLSILMTQNIDMLHTLAGSTKQIECHGTYSYATCLKCRKKFKLDDIKQTMLAGEVPYCECGGIIKPDIVFFGENLPTEFYEIMNNPPEADLLIVAGTSLTVYPAAQFPLYYLGRVPSVLINLQRTEYDSKFNYVIHEDIDEITKQIGVYIE